MPRVFLLEPTKVDVSRAADWGQLTVLFPPGVHRSSIWDERYSGEVLNALAVHRYIPLEDFFLVAGSQVPLVMASIVMTKAYGVIQYLFYNAIDHSYHSKTLGGCNDEPPI